MTRCKLQLWCRRELHTDRAFGCAPRHRLVINPCPFPSHQSSSSHFWFILEKEKFPVSGHFLEYEILVLFFFVLACEDDQDLEASSTSVFDSDLPLFPWQKAIPCYTELCRVIDLWSFVFFRLGLQPEALQTTIEPDIKEEKGAVVRAAWKVGRI